MFVVVNKPKGPTSFDIIAQIRKLTGVRKVGHAGTLDPLASGVLVVAIGRESTREIGSLMAKEKEYRAMIRLGMESSTEDGEGEKVVVSGRHPNEPEIRKALKRFVGIIDQVPSKFSAIKVSGKRSYQLARKGEEVELQPRPVEIRSIRIISYIYPYLEISVTCGAGTYIRALARDIGRELETGAYLAELQRTRVGDYGLDDCVKLGEIRKLLKWDGAGRQLADGQIGVMPSDTIYGIMGQAMNKKVVQRIYDARERDPDKPCVILISSLDDLKLLGVKLGRDEAELTREFWPGKVSVILPCKSAKLAYLHRGTRTLAVRLPDKPELIHAIRLAGPLIAPSANPEGLPAAENIAQARKYFGRQADFYLAGKVSSEPSTLVRLERGKLEVLRQGAVVIADRRLS